VTIDALIDNEDQFVTTLLDELLHDHPPATTDQATFLGAQFDLGLAWVHFPPGYGGLGLSPRHQAGINQRVEEAGGTLAFLLNPLGYGMCGPTIVDWGSEEQKRRYLRPIFTLEELWCQLFSEPGAGSDVAGLSTSAVKDGEEWVINGQKVWTSVGYAAHYGLLIARSDPTVAKHNGLVAFVVDMHAPGVEVRPLRQMTGDAQFCEVYFTDARIPDAERLGQPGEGWRVSLTTLMNERVAIGSMIPAKGSGPIDTAVRLWKALPEDRRSPAARDRLLQLWAEAEVIRLTNVRAAGNRKVGAPGPEGSIAKLASAEANKRIYEFCVQLCGADGLLYGDYRRNGNETPSDPDWVQWSFLRSRANSIEGGTAEVMRNILGERVLGLPGDIRVDRDRPWSEIPRS
jgi:alkylation response protein AidB-like acyl-CoA dehydrogenase